MVFPLILISSINYASANESQKIPPWFKGNASLWLTGKMDDQQFVSEIHNLITLWSSARNVTKVFTTRPIVQHADNCNDANYQRVNWSGCDHSHENLNHINLNTANWDGTNLSHANIEKADLVQANLQSTYLGGAILTGADLSCRNNSVCVSARNILSANP